MLTQDDPADDGAPGATEAALLNGMTVAEIDAWLDQVLTGALGAGVSEILFRSGRIDAVYGVVAVDGRRLLIKVHRPPVDLRAREATVAAQTALASRGFPCAVPIAGPLTVDGRTVSIETLLDDADPGNGHDPAVRRSIVDGLAEQIDVLQTVPDFLPIVGPAPAWCRYEDGPWPEPHDTFFDFRLTPAGWGWLDEIAATASAQLLSNRREDGVVAAHADWYCGNLRFTGSRLAACYDWDLVGDTVSVVAGLTAGFFTNGTASGAEQPAPEEVVAFLTEFEHARGARFAADEQRAAAAAATWSMCYTARCQLQMLDGDPPAGTALDVLGRHGATYLRLRW